MVGDTLEITDDMLMAEGTNDPKDAQPQGADTQAAAAPWALRLRERGQWLGERFAGIFGRA